jgi:hypothetical protein
MRNKGEKAMLKWMRVFCRGVYAPCDVKRNVKRRKTPALERIMWLRVLDEIRAITHRLTDTNALLLRLAVHGADQTRRLDSLVMEAESVRRAVVDIAVAKKEEALGPMLYDISASDLFMLTPRHRVMLSKSGITYYNDVCAVNLYRLEGVFLDLCQHDIDTIMEWRSDCVLRITEAQVAEAIAAQVGGN